MPTYTTEVLRVTASGEISISWLQVIDSDDQFVSGEIGTEYVLDGVSLGPDAPVLEVGMMNVASLPGAVPGIPSLAMRFTDGTDTLYCALNGYDVNTVASWLSDNNPFLPSQGIYNQTYGLHLDGSDVRHGDALRLWYNPGGTLLATEASDVTVWDDDDIFELDGLGGGPASETGAAPQALGGSVTQDRLDIDTSDAGTGDTNLVHVTLTCATATGNVVFDAIRCTRTSGAGTFVYYIPENGHADLASVTGVVSEVPTGLSVDGLAYGDYGLNRSPERVDGDGGANILLGLWYSEKLTLKGGSDTGFGAAGADEILGGGGSDALFGGRDEDTLDGGGGSDLLRGGSDADTLAGGDGTDSAWGGFGEDSLAGGAQSDELHGEADRDTLAGEGAADSLYGGDAADELDGGDGNDRLFGGRGGDRLAEGAGRDTLEGGGGADVFVIRADGTADRIEDYVDGTDLIDINAAFSALTIIDIAPGTVEITHAGETLTVSDGGANTLTAADFSRADIL
jgi:Ca2+-binding RTX toxin-like protein